MKKVAIIGAGPAGLSAAYRLATSYSASSKDLEITIFEKGKEIQNRKCAKIEERKDCAKCSPCNIVSGVGGAGLFSDGKLIYSNRTGNNLPGLIGDEKSQYYLDEVEKIFSSYGVDTEKRDFEAEAEIERKAFEYGIEFIPSKQTHIGSDKLPSLMDKIISDLKANGVKINSGERLEDILDKKIVTSNGSYDFDSMIIATGRDEKENFENICKKININYEYNPVDIGVRVEVPYQIMEKACKVNWDFKARIRLENDDEVRTFCVCPRGFVAKEDHGDYTLVNGYSSKDKQSENTNFAFLVKWKPKNPDISGDEFGRNIACTITKNSGGMPTLQKFGDFKKRRRSTWERISRGYVKPTLKDVNPGRIGSSLPEDFAQDIKEGLIILDKLVPGIASDSTLLYSPEIKMHGIKVLTNEYLESNKQGIYFAGDCSGYSRGIVGAAASGLLAADGILLKQIFGEK